MIYNNSSSVGGKRIKQYQNWGNKIDMILLYKEIKKKKEESRSAVFQTKNVSDEETVIYAARRCVYLGNIIYAILLLIHSMYNIHCRRAQRQTARRVKQCTYGSLDPDVPFPSFFIFIIIVFEWWGDRSRMGKRIYRNIISSSNRRIKDLFSFLGRGH